VKIYKTSSNDNTCNIFHKISKPAPWFVFEQRFVAKNSTSVNLSKRFETRVIEHSIYYYMTAQGLTAIFTEREYAVFTSL